MGGDGASPAARAAGWPRGRNHSEERTKLTNLEKRRRILILRSNFVLSAPWYIYLQGYFSWNEPSCLIQKLLHWWNYFTFHEKCLKVTISLIFRSLLSNFGPSHEAMMKIHLLITRRKYTAPFGSDMRKWETNFIIRPEMQQFCLTGVALAGLTLGAAQVPWVPAKDLAVLHHPCPVKDRVVESVHILQHHWFIFELFVNLSHLVLWKHRLFLWCLCKEHLTELAKNLNLLSCFKL